MSFTKTIGWDSNLDIRVKKAAKDKNKTESAFIREIMNFYLKSNGY